MTRPNGRAKLDLSGVPNLVQYLRGHRRLILREEAAIMFGDHLRRILYRVAGLLVRAGMLEDMGRQNVPYILSCK